MKRQENEMNRSHFSLARSHIGLMTVVVLGLGLSVLQAQDKAPDATLKLSAGSVAAGIGISWGSGTLTYKGHHYPISVNGLSIGDVGIANIEASGKVYNLKHLDDFNGNYTGITAGAAVAGGDSATTLRNQNGVSVDLAATTQGVKFSLAADGVDMKIKK
jgi:hypothetical protein